MMVYSDESASAGGLGASEDQIRKRQSRFQGHWDSAGGQRPSLQTTRTNPSLAVMSGGEHGYNWDSLVSGSSTATPGTDTGGVHHNNNLKTFSGTADDDWSDLLNLA
ncbi:hypothetical protein GGH95_000735 [Coemansia sp. RSA 1836]|nr:hypothetical protein GGH95_000735 [Coemansia sp. RSA 1836]